MALPWPWPTKVSEYFCVTQSESEFYFYRVKGFELRGRREWDVKAKLWRACAVRTSTWW